VNDTQTIETSNPGHLTPDEVLQLEIQAANERRRMLAEMGEAAEARGAAEAREQLQAELAEREAEAKASAERALLLELATTLAPGRCSELAELESLTELKREVMALVSRLR
jgi:hypothetical protein